MKEDKNQNKNQPKRDQVIISLKSEERTHLERVKKELGFGSDQDAIMSGFREAYIKPYAEKVQRWEWERKQKSE